MRSFSTWSIRTHLLILVLLAVVPALVMVWWSGRELQRQAVDKANATTMRLTNAMAEDLVHVEENARLLLAALAQVQSVREGDLARVSTLFARLGRLNSAYARLAFVDPVGRILAVSVHAETLPNVADREYFREAVRSRSFTVGDYAVCRLTGRPTLHFAYPVFAMNGSFSGVLCIAYDLRRLTGAFRAAQLPKGSVMALADSRGVLLYRYPDPGSWIGRRDSEKFRKRLLGLGESGAALTAGEDGVRRLYAAQRVRRGAGMKDSLLVRVGIPENEALAEAWRVQGRNAACMALAALLAVCLAWVLGNWIILRRLGKLMGAVRRFGEGDLTARSGLGHDEGELGRLAESFDNMALALDTRETERMEFERKLQSQALHDPLTGLANRTLALDRVQQTLERFKRRDDLFYAVVVMDLDRFKVINDSLGQAAGDEVLADISRRVVAALRDLDTVARLEGDAFILLLEDLATPGEAIRIIKRVREAVMAPLPVAGREVRVTASFGLVLSPNVFERAEELLQNATIALHHVKAGGRGRFKVFTPRLLQNAVERLTLEQELRMGLERGEFEVHYQPIWDLATGRMTGFEALARWRHPERGLVGPGSFISLAEETGLILELGRVVLERACSDLAAWREADPAARRLSVAVNLSGKQFAAFSLVDQVRDILKSTGLPPDRLKLEITESTIMVNAESALVMLRRLKALGVQISIDDFGTGYSSLSYLQRFPVDTLKVDRSFVSRLGLDPENREIIRAIVALAHSLGLDVIAEGVEEGGQADMLHSLGCECVQGFYFSRPLDGERARAAIAQCAREQ